MKLIFALLFFANACWSSSIHYYGWTPNRELVYHFESQILTGVPELSKSQNSGLKLTSEIRIQSFSDYSLRIKFDNIKFCNFNGEVNLSESGHLNNNTNNNMEIDIKNASLADSNNSTNNNDTNNVFKVIEEVEIAKEFKENLETSFVVHLKKGIVESFYVSANEPTSITNIKRSLLSQLQLDIGGASQGSFDVNEYSHSSPREESLLGDCQTEYTIHKLANNAEYDANESNNSECRGKEMLEILKNYNLDNCLRRPFFQNNVGIESQCDGSKAACTDQFTHLVSSRCIVCGDLNQFTIQKCLTNDILTQNPLRWNTEEKLQSSVQVSLKLIRQEHAFSAMEAPTELKQKNSLIFEFPNSVNPEQANKEGESLLKQPSIYSVDNMLLESHFSRANVSYQIVDELQSIAAAIFETSSSCTCSQDVAGSLATITKYMSAMTYNQLKDFKQNVLQAENNTKAVVQSLFYDVLSNVGTNPAVMLIKNDIESGDLSGQAAINYLQGTFRSITTPTKDLLYELFKLIKSLKQKIESVAPENDKLYKIGVVQFSNLLYRACVHPTRRAIEFPVLIYGQFCSSDSPIVTEKWIPFLESELNSETNKTTEQRLTLGVISLGKLGHIKGINVLTKVIEGKMSKNVMIRSLAVYSLKRIARINPQLIKPILMSVIMNPSENNQVRIAAISILPWSQPSTVQLQKIATLTWSDPTRQVVSFLYSTLKSLASTEVPELKAVGLKAASVIQMLKPIRDGNEFSKNLNFVKYVEYLKTSMSKTISWVSSNEQSYVPSKMGVSTNFYNPGFVFHGLSFNIYTQGMEQLLDYIITNDEKETKISKAIKEQLGKISEELRFKKSEQNDPSLFMQVKIAGYEGLYSLNAEDFQTFLQGAIIHHLHKAPKLDTVGFNIEHARFVQVYDIQQVGPNSAGFLLSNENKMSLVYSIKGNVKGDNPLNETLSVPNTISSILTPVINGKIHSHLGIICPFSQKFLGAGVDASVHVALPFEAELEVEDEDHASITLRTPEVMNKSAEIFHVAISPFTVIKDLKEVKSMNKSLKMKELRTEDEMKKIELDLGKNFGLSSKLSLETDAEYVDLFSYWDKLRQHSPASILSLGFLPSSIRKCSAKLIYNPLDSDFKELTIHFSLAKGKRNRSNQEPEVNTSHEKIVRTICRKTYKSDFIQVQKCFELLNNIEYIAKEAEDVCQDHLYVHETDRMRCHKTGEICKRAIIFCERLHGLGSKICNEKKELCLTRVNNTVFLKEKLEKMAKNSRLSRLNIQASVKARSGKSSAQTAFSYGSTILDNGHTVKYYTGIELVFTENSSEYQLALESKVTYPKIKNYWNTTALLDEDLKMNVEAKLSYGPKGHLQEVEFKSKLEKSGEHIRGVRKSPEYGRCLDDMQKNVILSSSCVQVRHQALSLNKIFVTVKLSDAVDQEPLFKRIDQMSKFYFDTQSTVLSNNSTEISEKEVSLTFDLSRTGNAAQLEIAKFGEKMSIKNIRLQPYFERIVPITFENQSPKNMIQKLSKTQAPCYIEPHYIRTFDNKIFDYEINDCNHLLFKDCSEKVPIAVLAKSESKSGKIIQILSGITNLVVRPKSKTVNNGLTIEHVIKKSKRVVLHFNNVTSSHTEICPDSKEVLFEINYYHDRVYKIWFNKEKLEVITDGIRIQITAPPHAYGQSCGLCGNFNSETSFDLKTPGQCLMKKNKFFAYSYMINKEGAYSEENSCSGIPYSDRKEFNSQIEKCVGETQMSTSLGQITTDIYDFAKPIISTHLFKKFSNQICISKEMVKLYPNNIQTNDTNIVVRSKLVEFSCLTTPTSFALERRATAGENLQTELNDMPVHFTTYEYEPEICSLETHHENLFNSTKTAVEKTSTTTKRAARSNGF